MATTNPLGPVREEEMASTDGEPSELLRDRIVEATCEIEDDCRVAVRGHASAAGTWSLAYYLFGLPTVIFAGLAGVSAFNENNTLAAGLAIAATISAAANTFLNAGEVANSHAKKRSEYEQLKNEIRHFRNITLELHRSEKELVRELTHYNQTRDVLNLESPQVSSRGYQREKGKLAKKTPESKEPARERVVARP